MEYAIHTDEKFGPLTLIDAGALADACTEPWWNQTLCRVNDSALRAVFSFERGRTSSQNGSHSNSPGTKCGHADYAPGDGAGETTGHRGEGSVDLK